MTTASKNVNIINASGRHCRGISLSSKKRLFLHCHNPKRRTCCVFFLRKEPATELWAIFTRTIRFEKMEQTNYTTNIAQLKHDLQRFHKWSLICSWARLLLFVGILAGIYLWTNDASAYWVTVLCLLFFIGVLYLHQALERKCAHLKTHLDVYVREQAYLDGDMTTLPAGEEYASTSHEYATDLDVFGSYSLFREINRASTIWGRDTLAKWLSTPLMDISAIRERQACVDELAQHPHDNLSFFALGELHPTSSLDWEAEATQSIRQDSFPSNRQGFFLLVFTHLLTILALFAGIWKGNYVLFTTVCAFNVCLTLLCSKQMKEVTRLTEGVLGKIAHTYHLIRAIEERDLHAPLLKEIKQNLHETQALKAYKELHNLQNTLDNRSNALLTIVFNAIFLKDLYLIRRLNHWFRSYARLVSAWEAEVGKYEALLCMANYKVNHPHFVQPQEGNKPLEAKGILHPLMRTGVKNDFSTDSTQIYIMTGANMSGKSTFLRAVGLNLVLALSGNVVASESFSFLPMRLFTSMRTTDNLGNGISYFNAELLRLQHLHRLITEGKPLFILLDEILKGTNSVDKLNGSKAFLGKLTSFSTPISGIVATHDLGLGELEQTYPQRFSNICFEIDFSDTDVVYTYLLRPGICRNMNASFLLEKFGLV